GVVERAGFFGEQISDESVVLFVLEKCFVRADDFGVFLQTLAHARAQPDETFNTFGGQKRVAKNLLCFLPDTVHAARTLDEPDDGPRQIVVHDDGRVLEILAFAQNIRGDDDAQFSRWRDVIRFFRVTGLIAFRAEAASKGGRVFGIAGDSGELFEVTQLL